MFIGLRNSLATLALAVLCAHGCVQPSTPDADPGPTSSGGSGGQASPTASGGSGGSVIDGTGGAPPAQGGVSGTGGSGGAGGVAPTPPDAGEMVPPADAGSSTPDAVGGPRPPQPTGPGKIVLVAGGGNGGDGTPAVMARVNSPFGAVANPLTGEIYIAEYAGGHVRKVDKQGMISTVMGARATGPGSKITLGRPHNLMFQPNSHILFVADTFAGRVIRMDTTTGESEVFHSGGGQVFCLAFDPTGENIYLSSGGVTVINLKTKAAKSLGMPTPGILAMDSKMNLYSVTGRYGNALRLGTMNVMGGGGLAGPKGMAIDLDDNVLLAETENGTITRWSPTTKTLTKLAGSGGGGGGTLGGAPTMAGLGRPHGVAIDTQGRIIIADSNNNRVLRIEY